MDSSEYTISQIKKMDFLKDSNDEILNKIAQEVIEIEFDKNEYILKEGRKGVYFFFLIDGTISILEKDKNDELQQIASLTAPSYFGELALIYGTKRSATIKTETKVKAYSLSKESFDELILKNDKIKENLLKSITASGRLKKVSLDLSKIDL